MRWTLPENPRHLSAIACRILFTMLPLFAVEAGTTDDRPIYKEGFLQVVSPDGATLEQCKTVARRVMAAWKFDLNVMHWAHPAEMDRPLILRLISNERMKQERPGDRAYAQPPGNRFHVNMDLLTDASIDLTIAHELGHIQAFRALYSSASQPSIPTYFLEGHGLMMNQYYADHLHIDRTKGGSKQVKVILAITPEETQTILTDNKYFKTGTPQQKISREYKMECVGLFFVEYLRTRTHIANAVPRMGSVFELVGRGKTFEQAFAETYGLSLDKAVSGMVEAFQQTMEHPADRVRGTRFEEFLPK